MEGAGNDAQYDQLKRLATPPALGPKPAIAGAAKQTKEVWPVDEAAGSAERAGEGSARMAALKGGEPQAEGGRCDEARGAGRKESATQSAPVSGST